MVERIHFLSLMYHAAQYPKLRSSLKRLLQRGRRAACARRIPMASSHTFTANALVYRAKVIDGFSGICTEEPSEERFVFNPSTCTYVKRRSGQRWNPVVVVDVRGGMAAAVGARADAMSLMVIALEPDAQDAGEEAGRGPVHLQLPLPFCAPLYSGACAIVALVVSRSRADERWSPGAADGSAAGAAPSRVHAAACATPITSVGVSQKKLRTLIRNWPHSDVARLFLQYVRSASPPPLRCAPAAAAPVDGGRRARAGRRGKADGCDHAAKRCDLNRDTTSAAAAGGATAAPAAEREEPGAASGAAMRGAGEGCADTAAAARGGGSVGGEESGDGGDDEDDEDEDDNDSEDPTVAGQIAAGIDTDAPVGAVTRDGRKRGAAPARGPSARQAVMRAAVEAKFVHADIAVRFVSLWGDAAHPAGDGDVLRTMLHGVGESDKDRAERNSDAETVASAAMTEYGATLELGPDGLPLNAPDASDVEVEVGDDDEHSYASSSGGDDDDEDDEDTAAHSADDADEDDPRCGGDQDRAEEGDDSSAAESPRATRAARRARGRKFGAALLGGGDTESESSSSHERGLDQSEEDSDERGDSDAYLSADEGAAEGAEGDDGDEGHDDDSDEDDAGGGAADDDDDDEEDENVFATHISSGKKRARTRGSRSRHALA